MTRTKNRDEHIKKERNKEMNATIFLGAAILTSAMLIATADINHTIDNSSDMPQTILNDTSFIINNANNIQPTTSTYPISSHANSTDSSLQLIQ